MILLTWFLVWLVFRDFEDMYYGLGQMHTDAMDVFSHFNSQLLATLARSSRLSLEKLRKYTNTSKYT